MSEMHAKGGPRTCSTVSAPAPGVLEGAHRVDTYGDRLIVVAHKQRVAWINGPLTWSSGEVGDLKYRTISAPELTWFRPAALAILQGSSLMEVLGFSICLWKFTKKKVWDPHPGLTDVRAVVPYENPRGLPPMDVIRLIVGQ